MRYLVYILTFLTNLAFGQTVKLTELEIEKYAKTIDRLKAENKLVKVSYYNMSPCGGALDGYYLNKKLVLIDANFYVELGGVFSQKFYIEDNKNLKIIYRESYAEQDKYYKNYPADSIDIDPTKMTYTDTVCSILLSNPTIFYKKADKKIISKKTDQLLIDRLINCGQEMRLELQEVIKQVDSLKFVKEMPYMCHDNINMNERNPLTIGCGDELYWDVVRLRNNFELLIDRLDDTTTTEAIVPLFGYYYTTADIAYTALQEIIHDIPTFELLGVPFDKDGCGYCSYWQHLNKDFTNRQKFKEAVKSWYHQNKDSLIWIESNAFATCDCSGQHPNRGHFRLKTSEK